MVDDANGTAMASSGLSEGLDGGLEALGLLHGARELRVARVERRQIRELRDERVLERARGRREEDQPLDRGVRLRDARCEIPALTVADEHDPRCIHTRLRTDHRDRRMRRVLHLLLLRANGGRRLHVRAFVVAKDGDAAAREPEGEILEHLERADRLVAIVRPGAVHEDDHGEGLGPLWHREGARQHRRRADLDDPLLEGIELRIRWRLPRGRRVARSDEEAGHAVAPPERDAKEQWRVLEGRPHEHQARVARPGWLHLDGLDPLECARLRLDLRPHPLKLVDRQGGAHLVVESRDGPREIVRSELADQIARPVLVGSWLGCGYRHALARGRSRRGLRR
jgi:hypothetical protein